MNMLLRKISILAVAGLWFLHALISTAAAAEFCVIGGKPTNRVVFDLDKRRIVGVDGSSVMETIDHGSYVGIVSPLPMMVPSFAMPSAGQTFDWQAGRYKFHAWASTIDPKWILVEANPVDPPQLGRSRVRNTMLYSMESGVLAYEDFMEIGGKEFHSELYLCSKDKLRLTDLAKHKQSPSRK